MYFKKLMKEYKVQGFFSIKRIRRYTLWVWIILKKVKFILIYNLQSSKYIQINHDIIKFKYFIIFNIQTLIRKFW